MTEISIVKSGDTYKGFTCLGHSGYADEGEDIVCAAISVLTINTINSIDELTLDQIIVSSDEEDADLQMYFTDEPSSESVILMKSLELGLKAIASQYGQQYVKVVIQEV